MKTVLVVEDEKVIRQGIAAMVRRAPVPVDRVVECRSGAEALEAAERYGADVVFTDLRMPKMDGMELVRRLRRRPVFPLVVVISGYNDFGNAVELMRMGARDYLLKPVDRDQVADILARLEQELAQRASDRQGAWAAAVQVARALMQGDAPGDDAVEAIARQYGQFLFAERYRVVCFSPGHPPPAGLDQAVDLGHIGGHRVLLAAEAAAEAACAGANAGVSAAHSGLAGMRAGFLQAQSARRYACLLGRTVHHGDTLPAARARREGTAEVEQIVQLIGRGRAEQARRLLGELLLWAQNGLMTPEAFANAVDNLLHSLCAAYVAFPDVAAQLESYRGCWQMESAFEYYEALSRWITAFAARLHGAEDNEGRRKVHEAAQYVRRHFAEEINMAVVSNQVSMNYSQFSTLFKRYTGQHFQDYLRQLRIGEARRLLAETDLGVRQVGAAAGFKNEKHFMRVFKQSTGVSPGDYRKNTQLGK